MALNRTLSRMWNEMLGSSTKSTKPPQKEIEQNKEKEEPKAKPPRIENKKIDSFRQSVIESLKKDCDTPPEFICSLSKKLLVDPILTPQGVCFSKEIIEKFLSDRQALQIAIRGQPYPDSLTRQNLLDHSEIKKIIEEFTQNQQDIFNKIENYQDENIIKHEVALYRTDTANKVDRIKVHMLKHKLQLECEKNIPEIFFCSIDQTLLQGNFVITKYGHLFNILSIKAYLTNNRRCSITAKFLTENDLYVVSQLKKIIIDFHEQYNKILENIASITIANTQAVTIEVIHHKALMEKQAKQIQTIQEYFFFAEKMRENLMLDQYNHEHLHFWQRSIKTWKVDQIKLKKIIIPNSNPPETYKIPYPIYDMMDSLVPKSGWPHSDKDQLLAKLDQQRLNKTYYGFNKNHFYSNYRVKQIVEKKNDLTKLNFNK